MEYGRPVVLEDEAGRIQAAVVCAMGRGAEFATGELVAWAYPLDEKSWHPQISCSPQKRRVSRYRGVTSNYPCRLARDRDRPGGNARGNHSDCHDSDDLLHIVLLLLARIAKYLQRKRSPGRRAVPDRGCH
jgi:hypothetical protein